MTASDDLFRRIRYELTMAIEQQLAKWRLSPARAAKRLKITQARLSQLTRGKIRNVNTLMAIAAGAEIDIELTLYARENGKRTR